MAGIKLSKVLRVLRDVAPESLAASWDRVGLHVGDTNRQVKRALLCIDLTETVMAEAVAARCELIVAYHPPIFEPLRKLTEESWKERLISAAIRHRIGIYSPHTALDSVRGGITDWLCEGLGVAVQRVSISGGAEVPLLDGDGSYVGVEPGALGSGRIQYLKRPIQISTLLMRIKKRLGIKQLKVAMPIGATPKSGAGVERIRSILVCPGAGGSIFAEAPAVDACLTGELQHHQALGLCSHGCLVILAGHTNTERPYLPIYRERLVAAGLNSIDWRISISDRAPFEIR